MKFSPADIADILAETGEDIVINLSGAVVKTIRAKFRKDFEPVSMGDMDTGLLSPSFMVATSDMEGITSSHLFTVGGTDYRMNTKPQELSSGFTRVLLAKK